MNKTSKKFKILKMVKLENKLNRNRLMNNKDRKIKFLMMMVSAIHLEIKMKEIIIRFS